jgi:hypothetical protein
MYRVRLQMFGGHCFNHRDSLVVKSHSLQHSLRVRFSNVSWSIYTSAVQTPNAAVLLSPLSIDLRRLASKRITMSYHELSDLFDKATNEIDS